MYYSKEIIERIGSDNDLALRLDRAVAGVKDGAIEYLNNLGDATTRLLYYTSCFTDNYQDVCTQLSSEDKRFMLGVVQLVKHRDLIFRMVKIYIETTLKNKNDIEKKIILQKVIPFTTNYSVKQFSKFSLIYAVTKYICYSNQMNAAVHSVLMKKVAGRTGGVFLLLNGYAMVQHAADSANNLKKCLPLFYHALYMDNIEMMFFLIEPVIMKAGCLNIYTASDNDIANAFVKMAQ
ncbi:hypothetical protein M8S10_05910 [Enterobacter chuandaensis]|uniref:hypothetical protein n=1 Tax=Enterobacter chuandaensis TaxID=2497875 RepID=UPI0020750949|nr:hypothetical protein [Enterobacter chuandaensis]MCM7588351.1 hypothetical protein [Enterobacter chuandaensis]